MFKTPEDMHKFWQSQADRLNGLTIVKAEYMDDNMLKSLGLEGVGRGVALQLSDGSIWTAGSDDEFNGFGTFHRIGSWGDQADAPLAEDACTCLPALP